ncbi:MAG: hypothetical protein ACFFCQ_05465 [Promethearchaeota archaeon]
MFREHLDGACQAETVFTLALILEFRKSDKAVGLPLFPLFSVLSKILKGRLLIS